VHIPKCGGSSIEDILWTGVRNESDLWMGFISKYENKYQTGGLQHLYAEQIRNEVGQDIFNEYFKFSFVRNPWDKAVSQFSYMKKREDLREYIGMDENDTFKKYLELICVKPHVQWSPQFKFITDSSGQAMVDFVGKFENFEQDALDVMRKLGLSVQKIPHTNKSEHRPYSEYYDSESIEMVRSIYQVDIEMFNYSFPLCNTRISA
jgi:hypothetical protein